MNWELIKKRIKNSYRSLTIWLNTVAGSVCLAIPIAQDNLPQIQEYIPHNIYQYIAGAIAFANFALRFRTKSDLADKGKK